MLITVVTLGIIFCIKQVAPIIENQVFENRIHQKLPKYYNGNPIVNGFLYRVDVTGDGVRDIVKYYGVGEPGGRRFEYLLEDGSLHQIQAGRLFEYPYLSDVNGDGVFEVALREIGGSRNCWAFTGETLYTCTDPGFGKRDDMPVVLRFDADTPGHALASWRSLDATFHLVHYESLEETVVPFGETGDVPLSGDYTLDGIYDFVVYHPPECTFYIKDRVSLAVSAVQFPACDEIPNHIPATGDFIGGPDLDYALYSVSQKWWYVYNPTTNLTTVSQKESDYPELEP